MVDIHINSVVVSDEEIAAMSDRLLAFIFPQEPTRDDEKSAFSKAVMYQIEHEKTIAEKAGSYTIPEGVTSFSIGDFSMTLDKDAVGYQLTRKTICPKAYGLLLRSGLLYRGFGGTCGCQ